MTDRSRDGDVPCVDVVIVGAGLSGIGMAARLLESCPHLDFMIVERRGDIGGTWDLFRYPGIRSDSDMHTLGFDFEPWTDEKAIAGAPAILAYLRRIVDGRGLRERTRFHHHVVSADWDGHEARWRLVVENADGGHEMLKTRFLHLGAGYYDHDEPYDAALPGSERFAGQLVHPQFWPDDLEYAGKRVVVVGSGATAVTIVPSMAAAAARVTMLQRTPTWLAIGPSRDGFANLLRRILPDRTAYALTRLKNIRLQDWLFRRLRKRPQDARRYLSGKIAAALGEAYHAPDFTPPYDPWEQRVCLVPDGDFFAAMKAGKAAVVTGQIEEIDAGGIRLRSGDYLEADIIVTATGLRLAVAGKIALSIDGKPLNFPDHYYYKSCMLSNVPNLTMSFGYLNASWTLRLSLVTDYVCRLLNMMRDVGADVATPHLLPGDEPDEAELFAMSSGYLQRGRHLLAKSAGQGPWWLAQNYLADRKWMKASPVDDGIMTFDRAGMARRKRSTGEDYDDRFESAARLRVSGTGGVQRVEQ